MRLSIHRSTTTCCLLLVPIAHAIAAEVHYAGTAYAVPGGQVAYREEHWINERSGMSTRLVLYECPDGTPFARKTVAGLAGSPVLDFQMVDGRNGYQEGVRKRNGGQEVYFREKADAPEKSAPLGTPADAVIDAGFDAYVRNHWNEMDGSRPRTISFLIPRRLGFMDLKLSDAGSSVEEGEPVRKLRVSLDAWYGFAAPDLMLTYTEKEHRLRRFEGVSNVRDAAGRSQRVRIEFPAAQTPARLDAAAAAALPLAPHCQAPGVTAEK